MVVQLFLFFSSIFDLWTFHITTSNPTKPKPPLIYTKNAGANLSHSLLAPLASQILTPSYFLIF